MNYDEDSKYVEECLSGDVKAFEKIVDKYQKVIFRLVMRIANNYDDAEDIAQSIFIKVYGKLDTFNPQYKFYSWLYKMAVNETINFCNKRKKSKYLKGNIIQREKNPADIADTDDIDEKIQSAIVKLDMNYRIPLVLKYFMSYSYSEIAEILEIPERTLKSRLFTARHLLKEELIKNGVRFNGLGVTQKVSRGKHCNAITFDNGIP